MKKEDERVKTITMEMTKDELNEFIRKLPENVMIEINCFEEGKENV